MSVHKLYVLVGDEGSTKNNNELLQFIKASLPTLQQMTITVKIEPVSVLEISNPVLQKALNGKGINRLPALVTSLNIYFGKNDIIQIYSTKMREFIAAIREQEQQKTLEIKKKQENPDEQLSNYYLDAMNDKDDDNGAIGDGDQLRNDLQKKMGNPDKKRVENKLLPPREQATPQAARQATRQAAPQASRQAASHGESQERADNLIIPSNELEIAKKIANEYRQTDGDYNESDDLMLNAFWSRMSLTDDSEPMAE